MKLGCCMNFEFICIDFNNSQSNDSVKIKNLSTWQILFLNDLYKFVNEFNR